MRDLFDPPSRETQVTQEELDDCYGGASARVHEQLYRWHWRARLPARRGQLFRVLARGSLNSCLVEFLSDGWRCVTSRNALRRA